MITIKLKKEEVKEILNYLKPTKDRELYYKLWRLLFTGGK
jgi:hypothetical protein